MTQLAIIILAAGQSSRMKSATSKVLHKLAGWSVLRHVIDTAQSLNPERMVLVTSPNADSIVNEARNAEPDMHHAIQEKAQGTGDAVKAALPHLEGFEGTVLVLYGDSPLTRPETLVGLLEKAALHDVTLTAMTPNDPAQYGRIKLDASGNVEAIVEYKEATEEERAITLCNAGLMAVNSAALADLLGKLSNDNAKGEYYLTDLIELANNDGKACGYITADEQEMLGINSRRELAQAEAITQTRLRNKALDAGVGLVAPQTVMLSMDTHFGYDVIVHPNVVIGAGVSIADNVEIKSFTHLEGATIESGATVGPYARLRPGAHLQENTSIGNFVEVKNATLKQGAKAGHLSYIGDATIGEKTNIGAGTITCNYDGKNKHHTTIGKHVFVGSDTALVAPVTVGDNVTIAAGSVITDNVEDNALALGRSRQTNKPDWKS